MQNIERAVRVGPSDYGLGVYSLKTYTAEEWVGEIEGDVIHDIDYESEYCMALGESSALEPIEPFRFLNHSCNPNCALVEVEVEYENGAFQSELWLQVEAAITPGDQMTIDYGWPAGSAIPCHCGSADCRQWIVAAEELEQVEKYSSRPREMST